jgi:hypothetical protein
MVKIPSYNPTERNLVSSWVTERAISPIVLIQLPSEFCQKFRFLCPEMWRCPLIF